ncbi:MAG: hypothetical protein WBD50_07470 [Candidatus Rhabdochlamydia sp.]
MKRYLMGLICCLLTISACSKEENNQKNFVDDVNIFSTNEPNTEDLFLTNSISESFFQGGNMIILESNSKDSLQEKIAYPVEESVPWDSSEGEK